MGKESKKQIVSFSLNADLLGQVDELARLAGVSRSEVAERCLSLGVANQQELLEWLRSPVKGPFVHLMTHPAVIKMLMRLVGDEADPVSQKIVEGGKKVSAGRRSAKPAGGTA